MAVNPDQNTNLRFTVAERDKFGHGDLSRTLNPPHGSTLMAQRQFPQIASTAAATAQDKIRAKAPFTAAASGQA